MLYSAMRDATNSGVKLKSLIQHHRLLFYRDDIRCIN